MAQFAFKDSTIITTTNKFTAFDLEDYIEDKLENDVFPKRSKLIVFVGYHGDEEGNMGKKDLNFIAELEGVLSKLEDENMKKIEENDYQISGNVVPIHKLPGKNMEESLWRKMKNKFEEIKLSGEDKRPLIICIASCWSDENEFKQFLYENGIVSLAFMKNERGLITNNRCFVLDKAQCKIIELLHQDHLQAKHPGALKIRNLLLSGSFGTGKTVTLIQVFWMRVYYLLRKIPYKGKLLDVFWDQPIKLIQVILLQNFMILIFWFLHVSTGSQKPQTLTASKTKYI